MKRLIIYWFNIESARAAKNILAIHYSKDKIRDILYSYWKRYLRLIQDIPTMPTLGGSLMVHLAAMSTAFYRELSDKGQTDENATSLFYDIAWEVYRKMGRLSWLLAGWGNKGGYSRLIKATKLFRAFPFNSPSYQWSDIKTPDNVVGFDCLKCPVAEYFELNRLSKFCTATWCALDYPLAEMWNANLTRTGSIASGADTCDFRWEKK